MTEDDAYRYIEDLRWGPGRQVCPHCEARGGHWFLTPRNGVSRLTRMGHETFRRVWRCRDCRKQFSVLTGSPLQGTKIPIEVWAEYLANPPDSPTVRRLARDYGISEKASHRMLVRLRCT